MTGPRTATAVEVAVAGALVDVAHAAEATARIAQARVDHGPTVAACRVAVAAVAPVLRMAAAHAAADALAEAVADAVAYPAHLSATYGDHGPALDAWRTAHAAVLAAVLAAADTTPAGTTR